MCHRRGAHVACTRTYSGQGARKKIRPRMCTYGRGLERLLAHTYGQGSCTRLGRNGETASSSCSWGGNGMRRVHGEATECVVFIGRQRNAWEPTGWVETECLVVFIRRAWIEQVMEMRPGVPQNGGNGLVFDQPCSKRDPVYREGSGVPQNGGNSLVFDRPCLKRDPIHREGSGVPQNGGNGPPTVETGVLLIGRGGVPQNG